MSMLVAYSVVVQCIWYSVWQFVDSTVYHANILQYII